MPSISRYKNATLERMTRDSDENRRGQIVASPIARIASELLDYRRKRDAIKAIAETPGPDRVARIRSVFEESASDASSDE